MAGAEDLGDPGSYVTLEPGAAVFASDGVEVGRVAHVLAEPAVDIFDGIVLERGGLLGGHRFVDAAHVGEIFERGVVLTIDAEGAGSLPEPSENPAAMTADPAEPVDSELERKLRRAWDLISGRG
jgi:hypothetical protein